ncbi:MAG: PrsW family intramembrane metalloprotease [Ignavibacterium sp.]|jgi:RsiW-degrading membrane proteinase PrsW (M82 family)|nr:PrsW family intramembrane metalloprotease [Ignavibacterium sp.]
MLTVFSLFAAIIPMSIYLVLIWKFDRYDREPFKLVLVNYLWGALGAIVLALIGSLFFTAIASIFIKDSLQLSRFGAIVVAPIVEEITKGLFLLITISSKKFDNITDGIVYGGAIGLGFGMTENFIYFVTFGESIANFVMLVIIRSIFSAVMHCVSTATLGAFLAIAKFKSSSQKFLFAFVGLLIAMIIHSIWNSSLSFDRTAPIGFLFMIISIIIFISTFIVSIKGERRIIFNELKEETESGLIPGSHLAILSSPQRERKGWHDESTRKTYIKAATTLAFRKVQLKNSNGASKAYYERDVNNYREFIKKLLQNA